MVYSTSVYIFTILNIKFSITTNCVFLCFIKTVKIIRNQPAYFAERLELAMKGFGTNDDALIRIIVSRCEIDLANIKVEYERIYPKTLRSSVEVNYF